ncbi:hypothetical protein OKA04_18830 [Luteolibacter flavescens]|uniref:Efflux transporter periplasmic adaptor subunit n=1 Tax=Luteolibacter flavescens TaxID=1859460 RepID=A0ABT3FTE6_9BACT|nr:hypothetical protein [Luteolibacter flavescens]MCW1886802.1 hypothetical protein [Luteolibacter flavescens]
MAAGRFKNLGIALVCVAFTLAAWKLRTRGQEAVPISSVPMGELTIPVEIVEAGQAPRVREIRVSR